MATRNQYPVKLFWAPYGEPIATHFLGSTLLSSLLTKRLARRGVGGCYFSLENHQSPRGNGGASTLKAPGQENDKKTSKPEVEQNNSACKNEARNGRIARLAAQILAADQKMKRETPLPSTIRCGQLRSTVRSIFRPDLTVVQELSIKTVQKLEKACACREDETDILTEKWEEARFQPVEVDEGHLARFRRAFRVNVREGWNRNECPYIPNGHASKNHDRCSGGTWNREEFEEECEVAGAFDNGKFRIVTLYSSENSRILYPLHRALHSTIKRKGWLLVGSPTNERVQKLNGQGPYVSIDYASATDNIKAEYTRTAIEVLIEKAVGITDREKDALRVVGNLRLEGRNEIATRGQPMGSLMSFPILCLINKTTVDLALVDLMSAREISWEQFRVHRCLINGDDLLFREFNESRGILSGILRHGKEIGLVVNTEKTMVDSIWCEINSTAFKNGILQKKTNVSCVELSGDVGDPIGFLAESLCRRSVFRRLLPRWFKPIARAYPKIQGPLDPRWYRALLVVKKALLLTPATRPKAPNAFPVVPKPVGYYLSRREEFVLITDEVTRLQDKNYKVPRPERKRPVLEESNKTINQALKRNRPVEDDNILKLLADGWELKRKEKLARDAAFDQRLVISEMATCMECYEGVHSKIACVVATIKREKKRRAWGLPLGVGTNTSIASEKTENYIRFD